MGVWRPKAWTNFDEIWYTTVNLELDNSQMIKYENFKMADIRCGTGRGEISTTVSMFSRIISPRRDSSYCDRYNGMDANSTQCQRMANVPLRVDDNDVILSGRQFAVSASLCGCYGVMMSWHLPLISQLARLGTKRERKIMLLRQMISY